MCFSVAIGDNSAGPFIMQENPVIDYLDKGNVSMWRDSSRQQFYGVFHAHTFIGTINSPDGIH